MNTAAKNTAEADVEIDDCGGIVRITPQTDAGNEWIDENVQSEGWQWMGNSLCVDHRFADNLISGMQGHGLEVR